MIEELEWQTRRDRINKKLTELPQPWKIIKYQDNLDVSMLTRHAVEEFQTDNGPADYALFVKGKLLGIIEGKKVGVGAQNVLEQAKRYSRGAKNTVGKWGEYKVPLLYSSNGENEFFIDVRNEKSLSRKISNFHTPEGLNEIFERGQHYYANLSIHTQPEFYRIRLYQSEAITAIEKALQQGKREMLVAMATGTGKTYLTVAQIYRLLSAGVFKRILFLVDRRALAAQAVREFATFTTPKGYKFNQEYECYSQKFKREDFEDDEPFNPNILPNSYLTSPQPSNTFVYVSTIQRMTINLFGWQRVFEQDQSDPDYEEEAERINIPNHAFDLIIADECHRGYTANETAIWRDVMEYFDAVKIGLTATPAPHSLSLFKEIVFRYTTDQAIEDGYLCDYESYKIKSDVLIKGTFLKEGEHVGVVNTETGEETYDELEDERTYSAEEIERKITSPDTNKKIVKEIAQYARTHEQETGRFPKILIFAANDLQHTSHADQLVQLCREEFGQGDDFVQKITGNPNVDRPLEKIRKFRNRPKPMVVVTVDMLSTGVDIPALEFIVFLRVVKSRILWTQMLGRGTRRCDAINKKCFKIFDCFDGTLIEYFKNTTDFRVEDPRKEPIPLAQVIENIYQNVDRNYFTGVLIKRLRRIEKDISGEAREKFAEFIPEGNIGKFTDELRNRIAKDFVNVMALLRNKKFQELCLDYPRAKRTFLKGYEIVDNVSSEAVFSVGGVNAKPQDYLELFSKFVKENKNQIEAIKVLLYKPKDWKTDVLNDLRTKLQKNDFPEEELQRAHKLVSNKALADIISIVKHAAREEEPLLTIEERVNKALNKVKQGKEFSEQQTKWIDFIRYHLIQSLTLDLEDFDLQPVFTDRGGKKTAQEVFVDLHNLITEINLAMAA
ncbi:MAG: restriction endonuclease subunit R [Chlorobiaceae bacterium]|nr:restriction endonuclease subunit R [Chlorobiaceae bacterium]